MDRAVSNQTRRKRSIKKAAIAGAAVTIVAVAIWGLRKTLESHVDGRRLQTATAELGPIENTLTAAGEVLPAFEEVIASSIQANIREVLLPIGSEVNPGTPILQLDRSFALLEFEQLQQELELKQNGIAKLQLELEKNLFDLQITDSIKALRIHQLETELEDAQYLQKVGGGSREAIDLAQLNLQIARLEKRQLEHDLGIQRRQTQTSLRELEIQSSIQTGALRKMQEKLDRAQVVATRPGVLTWANENLGATVNEGEILARIADLRSYKVAGTCSSLYADRLHTGQRVSVQLDREQHISGRIVNIHPTAENNILSFDVQLDQSDHPLLRPNRKVEVHIVTASKPQVVRVPNGPVFTGQATQRLFVIEEGRAVRREVRIGLSNFDYVEIEHNISPGEKVILSDMERYEHLAALKID